MNKKEILAFLGKYLDTQELHYMTTVYEKRAQRRNVTRSNASLRTITDAEVVFECDHPNPVRRIWVINQVLRRLKHKGYKFVVWKAQNQKSPHIHVYDIKGLDKVDKDINREYKRLFLKSIVSKDLDIGINTASYMPVAMEYKEHFKYGTLKDVIAVNDHKGNLSNKIDIGLLANARDIVLSRRKAEREVVEITNNYDNTWFVNWITSETLPRGQRDTVILKNLGIMLEQGLVKDEEKVIEKLSMIYNNKVYNLISQWKKWAKGKQFSILEIIRYMENHDMDFGVVRNKYIGQRHGDQSEKNGALPLDIKNKKVKSHVIRSFS